MNVLVGLLPFILLPVLRAMLSARMAVLASLGVAAAALVRQLMASGPKSLNVLAVLLLLLAAVLTFRRPDFARRWTGVIINGGLAVYAFAGLAVGLPFSAEFARDTVAPAYWAHPVFLHVTAAITLVWALCFVLLAALAWPFGWLGTRHWPRPLAAVLVMLAAASFTAWYPDHARARFIAEQSREVAPR